MNCKVLSIIVAVLFATAVFAVPTSFSPIVKATKDGIVHINVTYEQGSQDEMMYWFFGVPGTPETFERKSSGTGFIIDTKGLIITNNHVIDKAKSITVKTSDGKEYSAQVVGTDSLTDLALIQIKPDKGGVLKALTLGDSDALEIGDWVIAIGSPQGLEWTVTAGIVSAKGRNLSSGPYDNFIQTDASINPGNSGGPLLNVNGEVVGINSMIYRNSQGLGFAVPVNMLKSIKTQLETGYVKRGWLGVALQPIDDSIAEYYQLADKKGALIAEVMMDSPAEKAGVEAGDIVRQVDSTVVEDSRELTAYVGSKTPNTKVRLDILRNGKMIAKTVTLGERDVPDSQASVNKPTPQQSEDVQVRALTEAEQKSIASNGVYVVSVKSGSNIQRAGVTAGMIITKINNEEIKSVNDFIANYNAIAKGKSIMLRIYMQNGFRFISFSK